MLNSIVSRSGKRFAKHVTRPITGLKPIPVHRRRAIRCGVTLLLMAAGLGGGPMCIFVSVVLAVMWASCVSELFARGLYTLFDSEDILVFPDHKLAVLPLDHRVYTFGRDPRAMGTRARRVGGSVGS